MDWGETLVVAMLMLVPGAAVTAACTRNIQLELPTASASVFACGYGAGAAVGYVLAVAHALRGWTFLAGLVCVTVGCTAYALRTAGLGSRLRRRLDELRAAPFALGAGLLVLLVFTAARARFSPIYNLGSAGLFRYWADALEMSAVGHVPQVSLQWGAFYPATVSKVMLNAFNAGTSLVAGADALPAYGALLFLTSVGTALSLWAVAWEMGLRRASILVPALSLAAVELPSRYELSARFTTDQEIYKAEGVGRMVGFAALALAIRAVRRPGGRFRYVGPGLLFAVAGVTHGIAAAVCLLLFSIWAVAYAAVERRPRDLLSPLAVAAVAAVAGVLLLLGAGGDIGLQGVGGRTPYVPAAGGLDPTAAFLGEQLPFRAPGSVGFYFSHSHVLGVFGNAAVNADKAHPGPGLLVLAVLGVSAVAGLFVLPGALRVIPVAAAGFAVMLILAAEFFSWHYDLYILASFGLRRLFDYATLALILSLAPWADHALEAVSRLGRRAADVATAVVAAALALAVVSTVHPKWSLHTPAVRMVAAIDAVRDTVPCNARMLVNRRSNGMFEALAGRQSLLEGMAPYLRPEMLGPVNTLLTQATAALADPAANRSFYTRHGIGYVVVIPGKARGVGGHTDTATLDATPFMRLVKRTPFVSIYRVTLPGAPAVVRPLPGYSCGRGQLRV